MTPEELNRTINFIIESQARLSAAQEQDRVDRVEFEKWAKGLMAQMMIDRQRTTELIEIQSRRLDRSDARLERAEAEDRAAQMRHDELQERQRELLQEVRAGLKRIFELLAERPN